MHKTFYASGFLYHSASQQILLQQINEEADAKLYLFRGKSNNGFDPQTVFKNHIEDELGVTIKPSSIHAVYDYVHDSLGEHFIFFVDVPGVKTKNYSSKRKTEWLPLAKLSKAKMTEQTRHDIVIGERVIHSLIDGPRVIKPS